MAANTQQNAYVTEQSYVVHPAYSEQQQFAIVGQQPHSAPNENNGVIHKHKKALHVLGITECIIGGFSVLLAVIANSIVSSELKKSIPYGGYINYTSLVFTQVSQGIWCGIMIIVTGILGIKVMNTPSRCMYIANMTMSIVTACISFSGTAISGLTAGLSTYSGGMVFLHSVITILCFAAFVINIIHSAFCCSGVCASGTSVQVNQQQQQQQHSVCQQHFSNQQTMCYPQQFMGQPQPQYAQGSNGQLMLVVNQPTIPQTFTQTSAFQQAPVTASPIVTQMPSTTVRKAEETYENVSGNAPPSYYAGI